MTDDDKEYFKKLVSEELHKTAVYNLEQYKTAVQRYENGMTQARAANETAHASLRAASEVAGQLAAAALAARHASQSIAYKTAVKPTFMGRLRAAYRAFRHG